MNCNKFIYIGIYVSYFQWFLDKIPPTKSKDHNPPAKKIIMIILKKMQLRFSVATLFRFVARFTRVRIEDSSRNRFALNGIQRDFSGGILSGYPLRYLQEVILVERRQADFYMCDVVNLLIFCALQLCLQLFCNSNSFLN